MKGIKHLLNKLFHCFSGEEVLHSTQELVQIYFDTVTFTDIERDKKIKMEAQLGLIGGTMGLLTGFSIISGIEIIFFLFRLGKGYCNLRSENTGIGGSLTLARFFLWI